MNNPPYIITDIFTDVVAKTAAALAMSVDSHYGYVKELNETLIQMSKSPEMYDKRFPLVWLMQPFTIEEQPLVYGSVGELRMYIMTGTQKGYKSYQRQAQVFDPVLYPIRNELVRQMKGRNELSTYPSRWEYSFTDYYYWGEDAQNVLNDIVDTIEVRFRNVFIKNNKNCIKKIV